MIARLWNLLTRRVVAALTLTGFLIATGVYIFVYLIRAFDADSAGGRPLVGLWHGDNFSRTILVAIFFLIGEVFAVYLALNRQRRAGVINLRPDVGSWLAARSQLTGESEEHIAERAIALYRLRLEGGPQGVPSVAVPPFSPG